MRIRRELEKYLYQSNDELLLNFKNSSKGENHFVEFIKLLKQELKNKEIIEGITLNNFKSGASVEKDFFNFMYDVRQDIMPKKVIGLTQEGIQEIKKEIEDEFL